MTPNSYPSYSFLDHVRLCEHNTTPSYPITTDHSSSTDDSHHVPTTATLAGVDFDAASLDDPSHLAADTSYDIHSDPYSYYDITPP